MGWGLTVSTFVNLCHGLVTVGQAGVAGGEGASAWLRGERHGAALLFWCERSRSWRERGVCVGRQSGGWAGG